MKQQIVLAALVLGLVGWVTPMAGQKGGKGAGSSSEPESTPMGIQHTGANAGSKYADFLYGVVKTLNKDEMILTKTQSGVDQTFKFNKKTKFVHDGKGSTLDALKMGDEVWVDADTNKKTGDLTARKVVTGVFIMSN